MTRINRMKCSGTYTVSEAQLTPVILSIQYIP